MRPEYALIPLIVQGLHSTLETSYETPLDNIQPIELQQFTTIPIEINQPKIIIF